MALMALGQGSQIERVEADRAAKANSAELSSLNEALNRARMDAENVRRLESCQQREPGGLGQLAG